MGRHSKKNRPPAIVQGILAENVRKLRDVAYPALPNVTSRNKALAKDAETTLSQVQRVLDQRVAVGIDLVERLANAFNVMPQDLLTPYFTQKQSADRTAQVPFNAAPSPAEGQSLRGSSRN